MQLISEIVMLVSGVGIAFTAMILFRNEWVFRSRMKLKGTPEYERLPSYNTMMARWWVWDIKKFL